MKTGRMDINLQGVPLFKGIQSAISLEPIHRQMTKHLHSPKVQVRTSHPQPTNKLQIQPIKQLSFGTTCQPIEARNRRGIQPITHHQHTPHSKPFVPLHTPPQTRPGSLQPSHTFTNWNVGQGVWGDVDAIGGRQKTKARKCKVKWECGGRNVSEAVGVVCKNLWMWEEDVWCEEKGGWAAGWSQCEGLWAHVDKMRQVVSQQPHCGQTLSLETNGRRNHKCFNIFQTKCGMVGGGNLWG